VAADRNCWHLPLFMSYYLLYFCCFRGVGLLGGFSRWCF